MAGYVCTVAGGKGGVGKTTTAVNVGAAFETEGYDVVVVDADLGMANLAEMLGLDYDQSIHNVLAGEATVSEALADAQGGMTVIPGEQSLEAFADADPAKLRKVIKTLRNVFDIVLLDTGAGLSHEATVPLGLADGVLLVTTPNHVAINDTNKTADLADRVDGEIIGGLVTRATPDADIGAIEEQFEFPLLGDIPEDSDATQNEPLVLNAPESPAADAYEQLTERLQRIFFEGADPAEVAQMVGSATVADTATADDEESEGEGEDEDDDDDSGGFGFAGLRTG